MPDNDPRSGPRLGFIGLGAMGGRMARRLLAAGYDLPVHDRTRERARSLEQDGATFAPTPKRVAAAVDVVFSSLTDDSAVEAVMFGPDGALAGARPGTTFIEMSTVSPAASHRLHEAATTRNLAALDAPVSGSTPQAEEGQLVILVGGSEEVYRMRGLVAYAIVIVWLYWQLHRRPLREFETLLWQAPMRYIAVSAALLAAVVLSHGRAAAFMNEHGRWMTLRLAGDLAIGYGYVGLIVWARSILQESGYFVEAVPQAPSTDTGP